MHNRSAPIAAVILCLLAAPVLPAAEVYKWKDAQGKWQYGDKPHGNQAEKVEIKDTASKTDPNAAARQERTKKLLNQYADERAEQQEMQAARAEEEKLRKANCEKAQVDLENILNAGYLYEKGDDGERRILSKEERAARQTEARKEADRWCKPRN